MFGAAINYSVHNKLAAPAAAAAALAASRRITLFI